MNESLFRALSTLLMDFATVSSLYCFRKKKIYCNIINKNLPMDIKWNIILINPYYFYKHGTVSTSFVQQIVEMYFLNFNIQLTNFVLFKVLTSPIHTIFPVVVLLHQAVLETFSEIMQRL